MVEIMALLMFVGTEQKLTEMTYMPSVLNVSRKSVLLPEIVMLFIYVQK